MSNGLISFMYNHPFLEWKKQFTFTSKMGEAVGDPDYDQYEGYVHKDGAWIVMENDSKLWCDLGNWIVEGNFDHVAWHLYLFVISETYYTERDMKNG